MFQKRLENGAIQEFASLHELVNSLKQDNSALEKISFNAENDTRIRLLYNGDGTFMLTHWDVERNTYVTVFPDWGRGRRTARSDRLPHSPGP